MRPNSRSRDRRGTVLPMLAVFMIGLFGAVALAVDVGMIAVTRTETQNAADAAAMAGARTLNGDSANGYNQSRVLPNARAATAVNTVKGEPIANSQLTVSVGSYTYDTSTNGFRTHLPAASWDTPNLVQARVTYSGQNLFARVFGLNTFNADGTAVAVHRPRDVAVILDMSGSMRFDTLLGVDYYSSRSESRNPETVYPQFGHYASNSSNLFTTSTSSTIGNNTFGQANVTVDTASGPAIVSDYYQNAQGSPAVNAFTPAPDSYATAPAGDDYLSRRSSPSNTARTVQEITNGSTFNGYTASPYSGYSGSPVSEFAGYTQGPRYWGKTFFIWPPDPRSANDWRRKFFRYWGTSTGIDDNRELWDSSGNWRAPGSSYYSINYSAILAWIKSAPNPFPSRLRAGRILYYDAIPDSINTSNFPVTNANERFWKEYIDYVLGVWQTGSSSWTKIAQYTGYGDDVSWGTTQISAKPTSGTGSGYMNYNDNPKRPLLRMWFGPMSMLDFIANYNTASRGYTDFRDPGTAHVAPLWAAKLGVQAAMNDVRNNHPNDFVSLIFFSTPKYSASDSGTFNRVRQPLGRDYQRLVDSLWFPLSTIDNPGTEIRPHSAENADVPRSDGGTCPAMGMMLAYNQFSSNAALRSYAPSPAPVGEAGGLGRKGSQRLVIFMTDGMANTSAAGNFTNAGANNSYYNVRQPGEFPSNSGGVTNQLYNVANQICALETDNPPGYSTTRKPVLIHCLAFGTLFEPSTSNGAKANALDLLQNIQTIGSTQTSASASLQSYKIIVGSSEQRIERLRQAFTTIMQDGVQISLIQ
ncbi:MAG: pilus assembly protein TadG-related protein [Isosphaeraceae bacterium]